MLLSFLVNIAYMLIFTETNEGVQKILIFLTWSFFGLFLDPLLIGDFSRIVRKPNHTCVFFKILFSRDSISIHEDTHKSFRFEIWSEFMFHKSVIYDLHLQLLLFTCFKIFIFYYDIIYIKTQISLFVLPMNAWKLHSNETVDIQTTWVQANQF